MCGYIRRVTDNPDVKNLLIQLGLDELVSPMTKQPELGEPYQTEHFYPAFGNDPRRQIRGLIVREDEQPAKLVNATWWFDCKQIDDQLTLGKRTTFNARNLSSPYWQAALRHHRGLVLATGLGESKHTTKKHQYLMEGDTPFLLGALYRPFDNDQYSCAVITRDSHPRFDRYHDKAFPLFLPNDPSFIDLWLDPEVKQDVLIDELLEHPKLFPTLHVTEVKTFKSGEAKGETVLLEADELLKAG